MKKRWYLGMISLCALVSLSSCVGSNASSSSSSPDEIKEVYEAYKANGGTLSYEEWLASIKGEKGDKGDKGDTGAQGEKGEKGDAGTDGKDGADGKDGKDGVNGQDGADGVDGKDGTSILTGKGEPASTLGKDGDSYIDTDTFDYYTKTNGAWAKIGNIKGAQGEKGETGETGATGAQGEKGADGTNGKDGKDGNDGKDGKDGATILTGSSAPDDTQGKESDVYLNTNNGDIYVKGSSSWTLKGNVKTDMGVYVVSASYDEKGNLILTYSDGTTQNLGKLKGSSYAVRFHIGNDLVKTLDNVAEGSKLSVPDAASTTGYKVTSWYTIDDGLTCPWSFSGCTVTSDLDLYAAYTCNEYTISFVDEKFFTHTDDLAVEYSKPYSLPSLDVPDGWTFTGWKDSDGSAFASSGDYRTAGDVTLYASWAANGSTITLDANGGSVEASSISVTYDESYQLPTPTKDGSTFLGWYEGDKRVSSSAVWKGLADASYTAKWTVDATVYALDAGNGTLGEGVEDAITLTSGSSYALPTPTSAFEHTVNGATFTSYSFLGWYLGDELVASSGTSWDYASSERTLVAKYEPKEVYYGYYPQSHVGDETITSQLNTLASSSSYKTDRGWYYLDGTYYASARQNASVKCTLSDGTEITVQNTSTIHWFKVEPIKWRILTSEEGSYSLVSSKLLRADIVYSKKTGNVYYKESNIRSYLNGDFYKDAFSFDSSLVQTVEVDNSASTTGIDPNICACDNTFDKVYLLSYKDCANSSYFKNQSDRMCSPTDYALCNYAYGEQGYGYYYTRSPSGKSWNVVYTIRQNGNFSPTGLINDRQAAIRPCITIKVS